MLRVFCFHKESFSTAASHMFVLSPSLSTSAFPSVYANVVSLFHLRGNPVLIKDTSLFLSILLSTSKLNVAVEY